MSNLAEVAKPKRDTEIADESVRHQKGAVLATCDHPLKNRHCEKRLIEEQRGANVELAREGLMERDAVLERESASDLIC